MMSTGCGLSKKNPSNPYSSGGVRTLGLFYKNPRSEGNIHCGGIQGEKITAPLRKVSGQSAQQFPRRRAVHDKIIAATQMEGRI